MNKKSVRIPHVRTHLKIISPFTSRIMIVIFKHAKSVTASFSSYSIAISLKLLPFFNQISMNVVRQKLGPAKTQFVHQSFIYQKLLVPKW